jgi:AcrR family transcriptional regulator
MRRTSLTPPSRNSQDAVRARSLKAAHELFTKNGYKGTTTKEISSLAGVAEPTLFRNFGSKAGLFETTIVEQFMEFITGWIRSWDELNSEMSVPELSASLVGGLFKLVRQDKRLFQELINARADPNNDLYHSAVSISTKVREGLRAVHDVGLEIASQRGLSGLDAPATIAAVTSMVVGSVVLEDWVVPLGVRTPSQDRLIREMTSIVTYGISARPPAHEGSRSATSKRD